ncbi:MAG: carbon monoxide dehydrogenase subunit G [Pseudomonadota bacterium]|nr:carbon monoxide dehydrogenase subunit G [Pseudomonadota bacterium]
MQMTGQQRIPATRQQVWNALNDPDVLKRCIPGCQSLSKESDTRLVATVEIKIGPIGARFNGTVELSDIVAPDSYTMTIEGQGGTVGSVRSIAKVSLSDGEDGVTVLSYDVDALVSGRLAQLGGPIMDATAKQLAARFFGQFGNVIAGPAPAAAGAATAGAKRATGTASAAGGSPMVWLLTLVVSALVGYLIGHSSGAAEHSDWMGIAIGLLLLIVGAAGFEFGRRSATPTITLDAKLLAQLLEDKR